MGLAREVRRIPRHTESSIRNGVGALRPNDASGACGSGSRWKVLCVYFHSMHRQDEENQGDTAQRAGAAGVPQLVVTVEETH